MTHKSFLLLCLLSLPFSSLFADEPSTGTLIQISGLGILLGLVLTGTLFHGVVRDYILDPIVTLFRKHR